MQFSLLIITTTRTMSSEEVAKGKEKDVLYITDF